MNQRLKEWTKRHPVEAFFILGTAVCFATLFPAVLIVPQEVLLGQILSFYLGKIGVYSPVLAGMFVTRIINPGREHPAGRFRRYCRNFRSHVAQAP